MAEPLGRLPLLLREKINLVGSGKFSGRAFFSALIDFWRQISSRELTQTRENQILFARAFDQRACSRELHGLIDTLKTIRQRILANTLLRGWTNWLVWLLIGLIALAAVSAKLAGPLRFVAILAAIGALAILARTWRNRPSHYESARRLDFAAGLQDRLSTAIYLGGIKDPSGMIGEQRKDALVRLMKVDPRGFFPVQLPANIRRASVLVLLAAGLCVYRIHHQPPLVGGLREHKWRHISRRAIDRSQLQCGNHVARHVSFSGVARAWTSPSRWSPRSGTMLPAAIASDTGIRARGRAARGSDCP